MTRAMLAGLAFAVLALSWPTNKVGAHTLPVSLASSKAHHEALLIAGKVGGADRPRISVRYCTRRTRHTVDCRVRYRFIAAELTCYQTIRVRFASRTSRSLRVSFPSALPRCVTG